MRLYEGIWVKVVALGPAPRITWVDWYGFEDGTIWWTLQDAENRQSIVCLDGRKDSATRGRLFEGTRHPKHGGTLIELGAPEEGVVISALSRWLASEEPRNLGYRDEALEFAQQVLLQLGSGQ